MPDQPLIRGELVPLVRAEVRRIVQANLWKFGLVILCVWLIGGMTTLGVGYIWATSRNQEFAYAVNANTCPARALIDKSISDTKKALAGYISAARDPSLSVSARERNAERIKQANRSIVGLHAFRKLYQTVPPHYNCARLPRKPPGG